MKRHATVVAYLALFVALGGSSYAALSITGKDVRNSSLTGADVRNNSLTGADVKDRSLLRDDFRSGQLPAGATGPQGAAGERGPKGDRGENGSKGDTGLLGASTKQLENVDDIACTTDVVVGAMPMSVQAPSRIWTHAHGVYNNDNSGTSVEAGLWLRLRDSADTTTLAESVAEWDGGMSGVDVEPLETGGLMLAGDDPNSLAPFTAPAGDYILQLIMHANNGVCTTDKPDFGFNQGSAMGFMLVAAS